MPKLITLKNDELSRLLAAYIQSGNLNFIIGSGASFPAIKLAGNIEEQIDGLISENKDHDADLLALDFIQELEEQNENIYLGIENSDASNVLPRYIEFLTVLDEILFERKNDLLPRQASIFTTNYDLFFEFAAENVASLILNDGFNRNSTVYGEFQFSPELFMDRTFRSGSVYSRQAEVPTVNLFKLHGSLNWKRSNDEIRFRDTPPKKVDISESPSSESISASLSKRALILPNIRKFGSTTLDRTYYDLLRFYANSLERENAVLIAFGFSFSDKHLLDLTKRALRNPTSQLVIFAFDVNAASDFSKKFEQQRNVLVISPCSDDFIDFEEFTKTLRVAVLEAEPQNE